MSSSVLSPVTVFVGTAPGSDGLPGTGDDVVFGSGFQPRVFGWASPSGQEWRSEGVEFTPTSGATTFSHNGTNCFGPQIGTGSFNNWNGGIRTRFVSASNTPFTVSQFSARVTSGASQIRAYAANGTLMSSNSANTGVLQVAGSSIAYVEISGNFWCIVESITYTPEASNQAPTLAALGPFTVNEGASATFTASAQDADGDAMSYAWDFTDDGVTDATTSTGSVQYAYPDDGTFTLRVTVSDGNGGSATATGTVTVDNLPPTATLNVPAQVAEGSAFTVTFSPKFDAPGDLPTLMFAVDCGSGYGVGGTHQVFSCTAIDNGVITVRGRVADDDGGTSEYQASVTITNVAPTIIGATVPATATLIGGSAPLTVSGVTYTDPGVNDAPFQTAIDCGNGTAVGGAGASSGTCTYSAPGFYTVSITVADKDGGTSTPATSVTQVLYDWNGFFQPVENLGIVNTAKAGSSIPVKFSLGGNYGLNILAPGYPMAKLIPCTTSTVDAIEETVTAGGSGLQYDAVANQYIYVWKTDRAWANQCRQLVVKLLDGVERKADFRFVR